MQPEILFKPKFSDGVFKVGSHVFGVRNWKMPAEGYHTTGHPFDDSPTELDLHMLSFGDSIESRVFQEIEDQQEKCDDDLVSSNVDRVWYKDDPASLFTLTQKDFEDDFEELIIGTLMCAYVQAINYPRDDPRFSRAPAQIRAEIMKGIVAATKIARNEIFRHDGFKGIDGCFVDPPLLMPETSYSRMKEFYVVYSPLQERGDYLFGTGPNGAKGVFTVWGYDVNAAYTDQGVDLHSGNLAQLVAGSTLKLFQTGEKLSNRPLKEKLQRAYDRFLDILDRLPEQF